MKVLLVITFCSTLFFVQVMGSTVYIADYGMAKMIELSTKPPYCVIQKDRGKIRDMLLSTDPRRIRQMSDDSIEKLEKVCNKEHIQSAHQGGFIYPGTKWCGPGNIARGEDDFGHHIKEDMCCREHDRCPKALARGECKQGICNNSHFTRSHCDCDAAFRKCLQNVNSETANTIGAIFFNIIQVICFKERTPCTQWQSYNNYDSNYPSYSLESDEAKCPLYFENSERYTGTIVRSYQRGHKKSHFVNNLLRKFGLL
ncbi:unnamed protein product [Phaedon cochleariae]|uniref:Phospholipase A2 n=1 Tax=Phaedon cochleariae TaxID=80249 RepID=A0A9P0DDW0_PHACE|nr:unnamed protein product [Phaedon cochleariae]